MLEIIEQIPRCRPGLKAVLFDFDGTVSTLRSGWESVMAGLMTDVLAPLAAAEQAKDLSAEISDYIADSTGIQTIFQMRWLAERVRAAGGSPLDPWEYKHMYNQRLMKKVSLRRAAVSSGQADPAQYLIGGSLEFLTGLARQGLTLFVASGTDEPDVKAEAGILGVADFFTRIAGAPPGVASCSKELVLEELVKESGYQPAEIAVIGDGKVEIELARRAGCLALGLATFDTGKKGINQFKRQRLIAAGAQAVAADFLPVEPIMAWLLGGQADKEAQDDSN